MYIGHDCLCVCLSLAAFSHYCTDPDVTSGNVRGLCPLAVHYWADLQLVHGFPCYDNIHVCKLTALYPANAYSADAEREMSASARTRSMAGYKRVSGIKAKTKASGLRGQGHATILSSKTVLEDPISGRYAPVRCTGTGALLFPEKR